MDCSCEMGFSDGGTAELFESKIITARKKHACEECRSSIQAGEKYEFCSGKWEGDFSSYKTCLDCISLRDQFFTKGYCIGNLWSEFLENLHDWDYEIPEDCIVELTPKTRSKVCQAIEEGWSYLENRQSAK